MGEESGCRISLSLSSGRISVRGESRPMSPLSMHWRSAMLVIIFVEEAILNTASSARGFAPEPIEEQPEILEYISFPIESVNESSEILK